MKMTSSTDSTENEETSRWMNLKTNKNFDGKMKIWTIYCEIVTNFTILQ